MQPVEPSMPPMPSMPPAAPVGAEAVGPGPVQPPAKAAMLLGGLINPADVQRLAIPSLLLLVCLIAGFVAPGTWSFEATFAIFQALIALSIGMLFGRVGLLSLCPLAFAAIGAWVVLWLNVHVGAIPYPGMLLLGAAAAVPAGILVGGLALRLRGVNLSVVTLAFAVAITGIASRHPFPGTLDAVFRPLRPAGFTSDRMWFVLAFVILVVVGVTLEWIGRRRIGHAWRAVRASERATAAAGMSVPMVKLSAFIVSAAIAGIGGGVFAAHLEGSVDVRSFGAVLGLAAVAAAVMLGAQSLSGALIAGIFAAMIPVIFSRIGWAVEYPQMAFGLGAVHVLSQGGGGISSQFPWRRPRRSTAPWPAPPPPLSDHDMPPTNGRTSLELHNLTVVYGSLTAVDEVSLSVPERAVVGIIGPNGAGKSTLVEAVCGFVAGYQGHVHLDGRSVNGLSATQRARAGLRRTFQQGGAIEELTVGDYIRLYSPQPIDDRYLNEVLGFFGLPPADEPIGFVDVGTRRVLEVAAVVAARPNVAFLDEPAAGLGPEQTQALGQHIREIPARFGCSVVLIEHDVELVASVSSHITVLEFGRVIASGTPYNVLNDKRVKAAYLGITPDDEIDDSLAAAVIPIATFEGGPS